MTPSVWQIICLLRIKSWWPRHLCNGLRKHAEVETQESRLIMRTITYLDRMVAVSTPGSSGWRCLVCLSVWGWLRRRHCFRSQESHRHWECPETWSVLHPASAHAPNNVTCSGDSGEGRPLCGQEDSDWVFGAKWSFYSPPIIILIFGSILSWIVLNYNICSLTVRFFIEIHNRRCALSHHQ